MEFTTYTELNQQIDRQFPFPTLVKWANEVIEIGNYEDPDAERKIKTLFNDPLFEATILPVLQSTIINPDVSIEQPNGNKVEILNGSFFYTDYFQLLEDKEINEAMVDYRDHLLGQMPRDVFFTGLRNAANLMGLIIVPHSFKRDEVIQVAKYSLDKTIFEPYHALDYIESTLLLYANTKVIANKLSSRNP